MATDLDKFVSVKILFNKEKNQVVCAEAGSDFVDILFSFLTLPMGTIARLIHKQKSSDLAKIGCMNLYESVRDFSLDNFCTDPCKDMLMYPKNPLKTICKDLKVKYDDTPLKYFVCADVVCYKEKVSYYKDAKCSCGKLLTREVFDTSSSPNANGEGDKVEELTPKREIVEVFVKRSTPYVITDNLKIMRGTPGILLELLRERGIDNVNSIEEKVLKLGPEEILNLLAHILMSKTPLTDAFLPVQKVNSESIHGEEREKQLTSNGTSTKASDKCLEVKIFLRKSNKKPLYAETMEDFVELLFSFLTFPLSNVVNCLNNDSSLECVDNLYKSIRGLDDKWFVKKHTGRYVVVGSLSKNLLLSPGIPSFFNCSNETLKLCAMSDYDLNERVRWKKNLTLGLRNPKAHKGESDLGFVKSPAMFIVSDCLVVKPCDSTTSNISFLKELDVPIDDIEEHTIKIGKQEALSILKASLTSNSAFAPVLDLISKKRKRDDSEIILD